MCQVLGYIGITEIEIILAGRARAGVMGDLGPGASADTKQQAVECKVGILAVYWMHFPEALKDVDWRGRILIAGTNAHIDADPDIRGEGVTILSRP